MNQTSRCRRNHNRLCIRKVFAESDGSVFQSLRINVAEEERAAIFPLHSELLVEIAIIDLKQRADFHLGLRQQTGV